MLASPSATLDVILRRSQIGVDGDGEPVHGRTALRAVGLTAMVLVLAILSACSSSAPPELHATPTVSSNGQHYAFAGSVAAPQWPNTCDYITRDAAAAALETSVQLHQFNTQCLYIPDNSDIPVLVVETIALGPDLSGTYDSLRASTGGHPGDVSGVGQQASIATPAALQTTMNLLVREGVFQLQLRAPAGNAVSPVKARAILSRLGRAIATEFD